MITEVTIYEKNEKMYCPACKPKGGKKGTFGTSEYDHFCAGCGEDLKEIGEAAEPTMCEEGYENPLNCTCGFQWGITEGQQAWNALQAIPAYVERRTS